MRLIEFLSPLDSILIITLSISSFKLLLRGSALKMFPTSGDDDNISGISTDISGFVLFDCGFYLST